MRLSIQPSIVHLRPGSELTFRVVGSKKPVKWLINGVPGGNDRLGTIGKDGVYRAPSSAVASEVVVEARSTAPCAGKAWGTVIFDELRPSYSFCTFWNRKGEGPGCVSESHGICMDGDDRLLIMDPTTSRIVRFTRYGEYVGDVGLGKGSEPGQLDGPRDAKVSPSGEIFVADGNNGRIQVFDGDGSFLRCWSRKGQGEAELLRPHGIGLGPDGTVFVVDVDNSKVVAFDEHGRFLRKWGRPGSGPGEFQAPHGLAADPNGDVFVAEYHGRCQKFSPEGELLAVFANPCREGQRSHGDYKYHAMNSDTRGNVYLMARDTLDNMVASVDKYNNSGDFIARITLPPETGRPIGAEAAAVDSKGTLYVADNGREHAGVSVFIFR